MLTTCPFPRKGHGGSGMRMTREGTTVLLVEDDDSHAVLVERILQREKLGKKLFD